MKIAHYISENGRDIYQNWLQSLKDYAAMIAITRRVRRLRDGNFGNCRFCRDGVWELKIDHGPGYRVYYGKIDNLIVLLLCGGDKSTQDKDIDKAVGYLRDFEKKGGVRHE